MNRKGKKPERLLHSEGREGVPEPSGDLLLNSSLTRFDQPENKNQQQRHPRKRKNRRFNDKRNK